MNGGMWVGAEIVVQAKWLLWAAANDLRVCPCPWDNVTCEDTCLTTQPAQQCRAQPHCNKQQQRQ